MYPQPEATELRGDFTLSTSEEMKKYGTFNQLRQTIILTLFDNNNGKFCNNIPQYNRSYPIEIHA